MVGFVFFLQRMDCSEEFSSVGIIGENEELMFIGIPRNIFRFEWISLKKSIFSAFLPPFQLLKLREVTDAYSNLPKCGILQVLMKEISA